MPPITTMAATTIPPTTISPTTMPMGTLPGITDGQINLIINDVILIQKQMLQVSPPTLLGQWAWGQLPHLIRL